MYISDTFEIQKCNIIVQKYCTTASVHDYVFACMYMGLSAHCTNLTASEYSPHVPLTLKRTVIITLPYIGCGVVHASLWCESKASVANVRSRRCKAHSIKVNRARTAASIVLASDGANS